MMQARKQAQAAIQTLINDACNTSGGGILLRGGKGSGKTALLEYAISRAAKMVIFKLFGTDSEQNISYSGLFHLIDAVSNIKSISAETLNSLRLALNAESNFNDRHSVLLLSLQLLSEASRDAPVLLAVDNAHLVDYESASVLAFIGQRLKTESIAFVLTADVLDGYVFSIPDIDVVELGPLDAAEISTVLMEERGIRPSPDVIERIKQSSLGNLRATITLSKGLTNDELMGKTPLPAPIPIASSQEEHLLKRLSELPAASRTLLLAVALSEANSVIKLLAIGDRLGFSMADALEPAEDCGLINVNTTSVVFTEPLVREVVIGASSFRERQAVHMALAAVLDDFGESSLGLWHRTQTMFGPREDIAEDLQQAAFDLQLGHGCAFAAHALRRSAELSENTQNKAHRLMLAAEMSYLAGQMYRALTVADAAIAIPSCSAHTMARARAARGAVLTHLAKPSDAIAALTMPDISDVLYGGLIELSACLAGARVAFLMGNLTKAAEMIMRAGGFNVDDSQALNSIAYRFSFTYGAADWASANAMTELIEMQNIATAAANREDIRWLTVSTRLATFCGNAKAAVRYAEVALEKARQQDATGLVAELLIAISTSDKSVERWAAIEADANEALRIAEELGQVDLMCEASSILCWLAAQQGRAGDAIRYSKMAMRLGGELRYTFFTSLARRSLAVLDMGNGNFERAYETLLRLSQSSPENHPVVAYWLMPDFVECAVRCKLSTDTIEPYFKQFSAWVDENESQLATALRERCMGLLSEGEIAVEHFTQALNLHGSESSYQQARTQLAFGEMLRRDRNPLRARPHLRSALETFELMGAAPWANRARAELRASGRSDDQSDVSVEEDAQRLSVLTAQEMQIACLVGKGVTNREAASQLFLSHRTVEYHLHKMYSKLGVTSRAELARLVAENNPL